MKISEEKLTFVLRLILFILYLALGAAVFQALEKETQEYDLENLRTLRQQILSKYNISKEDANILVDPYEEIFVEKFGMWTYGNSFTFAVTVVTTVGESKKFLCLFKVEILIDVSFNYRLWTCRDCQEHLQGFFSLSFFFF